ncbi:MAG: hypothetical protein ACK4IY_05905, partial [Chitinophagales bacterium]
TLAILEWTFGIAAFILVGIVGFIGYRIFFRPALIALDILKEGEPATAVILKVWETGRTVEQNPRIGLKLEVYPPERIPFEVEIKQNVAKEELAKFKEGRTLKVKLDPKNPKNIAVLPR